MSPIGIKLAPGKYLERDLDFALQGRIDFIAIDGAQAATKGGPPILADDFCLPTIFALCRAVRFLEQKGAKRKVSLLISGGLYTPGISSRPLPWGPMPSASALPPSLMSPTPNPSRPSPGNPHPGGLVRWGLPQKIRPPQGAESLARFLNSCKEEMEEAIRGLGKTALDQVSREDLFALDPETAKITGVPLGYYPQR